jgi:hypothetical protein
MAQPGPERLTLLELFALFPAKRGDDPGRYLSLADSQEYLALVTWLVRRANKESEGGQW